MSIVYLPVDNLQLNLKFEPCSVHKLLLNMRKVNASHTVVKIKTKAQNLQHDFCIPTQDENQKLIMTRPPRTADIGAIARLVLKYGSKSIVDGYP